MWLLRQAQQLNTKCNSKISNYYNYKTLFQGFLFIGSKFIKSYLFPYRKTSNLFLLKILNTIYIYIYVTSFLFRKVSISFWLVPMQCSKKWELWFQIQCVISQPIFKYLNIWFQIQCVIPQPIFKYLSVYSAGIQDASKGIDPNLIKETFFTQI